MKKFLSSPPVTGGESPITRKRRPRQPNGSAAMQEIDSRLAQALAERAVATKKVSALLYYQDRLTRLNQEIESLIGFQQRLMGLPAPAPVVTVTPDDVSAKLVAAFSHTAEIPAGMGSMPTKRGPAPTPNGNAADAVSSEGGFS